MPALLTIVNNLNTDPGPRWRAGEAVNVLDGHVFGWDEMPKQFYGELSADEVNALDLSGVAPYSVVQITNGGAIGDISVVTGDTLVLQFNDTEKFWTWFGPRDPATYNEKKSYHWRVTDKETSEMEQYMQRHNKLIDMTVVNGPDPQGFRRIRIDNLMVTASGNNGWEQENVDAFIAEWNLKYPTANLVQVGDTTPETIVVEGTFTTGQAEEFEETIVLFGLKDLYSRRRWYITPAGMNDLAANNGFKNTVASELGAVFRDGLLD